jgi:hypothetical protein
MRREHTRGVHQLIGAAKGRIGQSGKPAPPCEGCGPGPLLLVAGKVEIVPEAPQPGASISVARSITLCGGIGSLTMAGLPVRRMPAFS